MRATASYRFIMAFFLFIFVVSCTTVPVTGRRQLNLVSDDTMVQASRQQYQEIMRTHNVITGTEASQSVRAVGQRIAAAAEQYLINNGRAEEVDEFQWEFNLIASDEINAWAMPGGKVAVYSGILPIARNDAGLAVIIGHEVAHVIANHGNERMSQQLVATMGGQALSAVLASQPEATQSLWGKVYGVGAQVGLMLPYSRLQERESDQLGMIFMAIAGFDPRVALEVWQRMAKMKNGAWVPEFLSTHPPDQSRIEDIREFMPTALEYYR